LQYQKDLPVKKQLKSRYNCKKYYKCPTKIIIELGEDRSNLYKESYFFGCVIRAQDTLDTLTTPSTKLLKKTLQLYQSDVFEKQLFYSKKQPLLDLQTFGLEGVSPIITHFILLRVFRHLYTEDENLRYLKK
jgi:hypothetical protein